MSNKITVIIHTHNEEKNIAECIEFARQLTDEIIVVDMESSDDTVKIAKDHNIPVKTTEFSRYVEPARTFGIKQAKTNWVLILDADERITDGLRTEIVSLLNGSIAQKKGLSSSDSNNRTIEQSNNIPTYFKLPRKNIFGRKKWLKHGGWWPDYQIRLINKNHFKKWPKEIHSTPEIEGGVGYLKNPIIHYFHGNLEEMVRKTVIFEDIESDLLLKAKRPVSTLTFFRKFFGELYRRLIRHRGFLDGTVGIIEAIYQAYSKTITYLFLYEKKKKSRAV